MSLENVTHAQETVNEEVQPSGIAHTFDTGYAIAYGVDEAIMIRNLQFFITANANRGHNFREGRYWTYDKLEDFTNHFPYWSMKQVRRILASLISQEVIIKGEFNKFWCNRTQWYAFKNQDQFIKNVKPPKTPSPVYPQHFQENIPDLPKWANGICPSEQMANADMGNCIIGSSEVTSEVTSNTSLEVPKEPKCAHADAPFSEKVKEVSKAMLAIIARHNPVYRAPKDMKKFYKAVEAMIDHEAQDIPTLLKTFEWGIEDNVQRGDFNGWRGILCANLSKGRTTNPAEIFQKFFGKIHAQMTSRPIRKFAASSDDEKATECFAEMRKNAL